MTEDIANIVCKSEPHIRYYSGESKDQHFNDPLMEYYLVIVSDKKGIRRTFNKILKNINEAGGWAEKNEMLRGEVKNSNLNYLFITIQTLIGLKDLNLKSLGLPLIKDSELYERKYLKVQDYVFKIYEE